MFPLRAVPNGIENHFYHISQPPLNVTVFIMHVRLCVMGANATAGLTFIFRSTRTNQRVKPKQ